MAATPTLTCKQCNYANEPERVYCHNCGAKLDRTILPKETAKVEQENSAKAARRVRKLVNPGRGFFTRWQKTLPSTILSALCLAALIQIVRPPGGVPLPATKDDMDEARPLRETLDEYEMGPTAQPVKMKESLINNYLAATVKTSGGTSDDYFKFDRTFVNLDNGVARITAQVSGFGYPIYAGALYKIAIVGDKIVYTNIGGNLGRLPVHPMIMEYCGAAFQHLWDALQHEASILDRMEKITIRPGECEVITRPHA